jgi:hypothetical protein
MIKYDYYFYYYSLNIINNNNNKAFTHERWAYELMNYD